jgi:hypothetical protein
MIGGVAVDGLHVGNSPGYHQCLESPILPTPSRVLRLPAWFLPRVLAHSQARGGWVRDCSGLWERFSISVFVCRFFLSRFFAGMPEHLIFFLILEIFRRMD